MEAHGLLKRRCFRWVAKDGIDRIPDKRRSICALRSTSQDHSGMSAWAVNSPKQSGLRLRCARRDDSGRLLRASSHHDHFVREGVQVLITIRGNHNRVLDVDGYVSPDEDARIDREDHSRLQDALVSLLQQGRLVAVVQSDAVADLPDLLTPPALDDLLAGPVHILRAGARSDDGDRGPVSLARELVKLEGLV